MINVLIVDDMSILRECLKLVLSQSKEFRVVGCASNGAEAIKMNAEMHPDVILMDLEMPVCSGLEAIKEIKKMKSDTRILVLTVETREKYMNDAFLLGADGYVLKDIEPNELFQAIKYTYSGRGFSKNKSFFLKRQGSEEKKAPKTSNLKDMKSIELTDREKEVMILVVKGMTNEEIAGTLGISKGRARNIVGDLISKYRVKNRTQLAVLISKLFIIDDERNSMKYE